MEDMTDKFVENPVEFLTTTPLIVQVPPESEFGGQPVRFTVKTYPSHNPRRPDKIPCQLQHDPGPQSSLLAYWCRYAADKPISLQLAEEANFMFTANMDGCSFTRSEKREGGSYLVCHSNAGNIAATLNEYAQNRGASSLVQKGMQKVHGDEGSWHAVRDGTLVFPVQHDPCGHTQQRLVVFLQASEPG